MSWRKSLRAINSEEHVWGVHEMGESSTTPSTYKQPPPPAYRACEGCRYLGYECTCAKGEAVESVAVAPPRFEVFSGTPHRL